MGEQPLASRVENRGTGRASSEYAKALRAEVAGGLVLLLGCALAVWRDNAFGALLAAVGAYLVAHTTAAYAASRGAHKAAASRPPALRAEPKI